jgi:hypothetical protein
MCDNKKIGNRKKYVVTKTLVMEKSVATKNVGYQTFGDGKIYGDKKRW